MATQPDPQQSLPPFLALPAELRNEIYTYLLHPSANRYDASSTIAPTSDPTPPLESGPYYSYTATLLPLLLTSRLVSHETLPLFHTLNTFIKITTPFPGAIAHVQHEGRVALLCQNEPAQSFQPFTLRAMISSPNLEDWGMHRQQEYSMVTLADELPAFTRIWHLSHLGSGTQLNGHLTLRLDLKNPWQSGGTVKKGVQERVLLPFAEVKGLHDFDLLFHGSPFFEGGEVYPSVRKKVEEEMAKGFPSPEEALEACKRAKEKGDACVVGKKYEEALGAYVLAFREIHIFVEGRRREVHCDGYYNVEFPSGSFKGQYGHHVRLMLRTQLVSAVMQVYLLMGKPEEALFWGQRSIRLFRASMQEIDVIGGEGWKDWVVEVASVAFAGRNDMGMLLYRAAVAQLETLEQHTGNNGAIATEPDTPDSVAQLKAFLLAAEIFAKRNPLLATEIKAWKLRTHVRAKVGGITLDGLET